jgi:GNAT superfamily N-acetyltransferase
MKQLADVRRPVHGRTRHNGPWVHIRPYESADADRVRAMSAQLSGRSLYERFFAGTPRLPEAYLSALAKADHYDREVLLALSGDAVIGIAEYIRAKTAPERADLAVLVVDDWQRRGVARRLVMELSVLAARRGIIAYSADALTSNRPALGAIASVWPGAESVREGTVANFTLPVREAAPTTQAVAGTDASIGKRG